MEEEARMGTPDQLLNEIRAMCQKTVEMLQLTWEGFRKQRTEPLEPAAKLCREIHQWEKAFTELVVKQSTSQAGALEADQALFFVPMHLERIGDNIELLIRAIQTMVQDGIPFSERAMREVNTLFEKTIELVACVRDVVVTKNKVFARYMLEEGQRYAELANEYALIHQQRLIEGVCVPKASSLYLALLDYLQGIAWHSRQIAQKLTVLPTS